MHAWRPNPACTRPLLPCQIDLAVCDLSVWPRLAPAASQWSEGDVWTAAVNLPNSATVEYKFIVLDKAGRMVEGAQLEESEQGGGEMQVWRSGGWHWQAV